MIQIRMLEYLFRSWQYVEKDVQLPAFITSVLVSIVAHQGEGSFEGPAADTCWEPRRYCNFSALENVPKKTGASCEPHAVESSKCWVGETFVKKHEKLLDVKHEMSS